MNVLEIHLNCSRLYIIISNVITILCVINDKGTLPLRIYIKIDLYDVFEISLPPDRVPNNNNISHIIIRRRTTIKTKLRYVNHRNRHYKYRYNMQYTYTVDIINEIYL